MYWLVVSTPLKNMNLSVGMMTFPTECKVIKKSGSKPPISVLFKHTAKIIGSHKRSWGFFHYPDIDTGLRSPGTMRIYHGDFMHMRKNHD